MSIWIEKFSDDDYVVMFGNVKTGEITKFESFNNFEDAVLYYMRQVAGRN